MQSKHRPTQFFFSIVIIFILTFSAFHPPQVHAQGSEAGIKRQVNAQTDRLSFIAPASGPVLSARQALDGISLAERRADPAMALVKRFGTEFGLKDPEQELVEMRARQLEGGRLNVRYQQHIQGIPVLGGELIVNTNLEGDLYSINGEVAEGISLPTTPAILPPDQAQRSALTAIAKWYQGVTADFTASTPELWIFDPSLLMPSSRPPELVWRMEVTSLDHELPVRELVLVNAIRGHISLHFNQIDTAWRAPASASTHTAQGSGSIAATSEAAALLSADVATYTAGNGTSLPGTLRCTEAQPACTNGADLHADRAHAYAIGTYNLFAAQHGRDSFDNAGAQLVSTVHYDVEYQNAYWSGTQMVYGDGFGFPLADDVVAHELAHGVTQHESNLFYFYQSGAINESFSDLWGEFYDQTNGKGNDAAGAAWQIGEEISGLGTIRDMREPPLYDQPDKMSSALYAQDAFDNGGVHVNSGINNKAVYLLVNGGSFNGKTVSALGWEKTAAIYYEANTDLLTSGADYSDLYFAVQMACSNLIGQKGITSANCVEVKDAIEAVEMQTQPVPGFSTDAPYCDTGEPNILFSDGLESGTGNWTFQNGNHTRWQVDSIDGPYAHSGAHSLFADDIPEAISDASARLKTLQIPGNAYLHFAHSFQLESFLFFGEFDGGVLEYSTDNGVTWQDAGPLMNFNGYNGMVATGGGNPIEGRAAFVASSHGYISTRLDLTALAGKAVAFRWRMGLDYIGSGSFFESPSGWWLDDVTLYTCGTMPGAFGKTSPGNGSTGVALSTTLSWGSSPSASYYQYCYDIINDDQCNRAWSGPLTATSVQITNLGANTKYYWQVRAVNARGITYGDSQAWNSFTTTPTLPAGTAGIEAFVGTTRLGKYSLRNGQSLRESFIGINNGPVKIFSTNNIPILAAERVIYKVGGINTSFSEMMGLPAGQLDTIYWLPWYNNNGKDLDTQLRLANVTDQTATVHIFIGDARMTPVNGILLPVGESTQLSYDGVNDGPVKVVSNRDIVIAERLIYKVNNTATSFSEMMALPNDQLDTVYWLPWYNNGRDLDTQLRFGNVSESGKATVRVFIGDAEVSGCTPIPAMPYPYVLNPGVSVRVSCAGINNGPVRIESDVNIVAAERLIYKLNNVATSFTEVMALPDKQLDKVYWLPWYNNQALDTQLRFGNVSETEKATVRVYMGETEMSRCTSTPAMSYPYVLDPGVSVRVRCPGANNGPVRIVSNVPIVAAERLIYKVNNMATSFTEMMALPESQLDTIYWLPWYNNQALDTQLRFGVP